MARYFVEPTSVLPDMTGRSDVIGEDWLSMHAKKCKEYYTFPLKVHPQEVLLAQFSLYVHKGGLKPDSFHFKSS